MNVGALLANITPRGRIVLGASVLGIIVVLFLGMKIAGKPSFELVETGLDPSQTGKITAALDEQGIPYEIRNNGTAVAVQKGQTAPARIALADKGLGTGGTGDQPGYELFDKQKLGASDFQQQVTYQRALEGQVAKTINQVDGVDGATVRLVLPGDELFSESQTPATAAVLLAGNSATLEPGAIRGIAQLVSSSVKSLKTSNVSITDDSGTLLWPRGEGGDGGSMSKQAAQARYEQQLEANLTSLLNRTVGPGKAEVQATVDLNVDQSTKSELKYADRGTPLTTKTETEQLEGQGATGGASGTSGNTPGYTGARTTGGDSNYERRSEETAMGVDKTITKTKVAPGAVNRLNVALLVDKAVPAADVTAIRNAVEGAAGVQRVRGDTLTVSQVAFPKASKDDEAAAAAGTGSSPMDMIPYGVAGLALLSFLVFAVRQLKRRESETLMSEPRWLREIETPTTLAELERGPQTMLPERAEHPARLQVEELTDREPERVAQQIRTWMRDS